LTCVSIRQCQGLVGVSTYDSVSVDRFVIALSLSIYRLHNWE